MYEMKPDQPYTMPTASFFRDARPWEQGGMRYGRNTALAISFLTDADKAAKLLPPQFQLGEEPLISVAAVQCEDVDWLAGRAYNLIGVDVAAVFDGEVDKDVRGGFCVIMWENMTEPILGGRDHSGVPKVYADIPNLMRHEDTCAAWASHSGYPILEMSAEALSPLSAEQRTGIEDAKRDAVWMNLKHFPSVQNDGADLSLVCTYPASGTCTAACEGKGAIRFFESTWKKNPTQFQVINLLADLPVLEVRSAAVVVWEPFMALDRLPRVLK